MMDRRLLFGVTFKGVPFINEVCFVSEFGIKFTPGHAGGQMKVLRDQGIAHVAYFEQKPSDTYNVHYFSTIAQVFMITSGHGDMYFGDALENPIDFYHDLEVKKGSFRWVRMWRII